MEQFHSLTGLDSPLLIKNLPDSIDDGSLRELLLKFGEVLSLEVLAGSSPGTNNAIVRWSSSGSAMEALRTLQGAPTDRGKPLEVTYPMSEEPSPGLSLFWLPRSKFHYRDIFGGLAASGQCEL